MQQLAQKRTQRCGHELGASGTQLVCMTADESDDISSTKLIQVNQARAESLRQQGVNEWLVVEQRGR